MKAISNITIFRNLAMIPETSLSDERQWLNIKWDILVGRALRTLPLKEKRLLIVRGYFSSSFLEIAAVEQMSAPEAQKNYVRLVKKLKGIIMSDFTPLYHIYNEEL